ncbi:hypothetical protein Dimus_001771 [Dionaea muscipula]
MWKQSCLKRSHKEAALSYRRAKAEGVSQVEKVPLTLEWKIKETGPIGIKIDRKAVIETEIQSEVHAVAGEELGKGEGCQRRDLGAIDMIVEDWKMVKGKNVRAPKTRIPKWDLRHPQVDVWCVG